jgi:hypothetical protein
MFMLLPNYAVIKGLFCAANPVPVSFPMGCFGMLYEYQPPKNLDHCGYH